MWTSDGGGFRWASKVYVIYSRLILHRELLYPKRQTTWSQVWQSYRMQRIPHGTSTCKEMSQKGVRQHLWQVHARQALQERHDRTQPHWTGDHRDGQACEWEPQLQSQQERNWVLPRKLVVTLKCGTWWNHAGKAWTRIQRSVVNNATPEASGRQEEAGSITTTFFILVFMALAVQLVGVRLRALASKMVWPLRKHGETRMKSGALLIEVQLNVQKEFEFFFLLWLSYNR